MTAPANVVRVSHDDSYKAYGGWIIASVLREPPYLLEVAINGRGAFRRFKDVLARYPGQRERWFKADRLRQRILEWLESEGIQPI